MLSFTATALACASRAIKNFRGVRVLALQDEYEHTNMLREAIRELLLTCVPQESIEYVYPSVMFPGVAVRCGARIFS
jgi:hypothetical protein